MSDNRTDLPSVTSANFLARVRETLMTYIGRQGDQMNRGLTVGDLVDAGLAELKPGHSLRPGAPLPLKPGSGIAEPYAPDLTPPPTPTGFAATGAISNILVEHDAPVYLAGHGHARTHLYGATWVSGALPVFTDAVEITQFSGNVHAYATNPATTWHLWAKWETVDGVLSASPAGGTNGFVVSTGQDVSKLLEALTGEITESQLFSDLGARIDLVDGPASLPGSVAQKVAVETQARSDALAIETNQRMLQVEDAANAALDAALAVNQEIVDRTASVALARSDLTTEFNAGISAEASERTLLATQLRGGYSGNDVNAITTGLLYQERTARTTGDYALSQQITLLSAGAGEQFDWKTIWYFDSGTESWSGNGAPSASAGWLRPANQASSAYVTSPAGIGADGNKYSQVRLRIRKTGAPTFAGFLWWKAAGDSTWDTGRRVALPAPSYDGNGISVLTVNPAWTVTVDAVRVDLSNAQTVSDYFEIDWVAVGRPSPGASSAQLLDEQTARAAADAAEVTSREALSVKLIGQDDPTGVTLAGLSAGLIYDERTARVTEDGVINTALSNITSTVGSLSSTVSTLETTVATATGANSSAITSLLSSDRKLNADLDGTAEAQLADAIALDRERTSRESMVALAKQELSTDIQTGLSAEAAARLLLAATVNSNTAAISAESITRAGADASLSSQITTLTSTVNSNTAAISAESITRAGADASLSSQITTLTSTVNGNTAAIQTESTTRATQTGDLFAKYTVKVDVNGYVSGFGLASTANNATPTSSFAVRADKFYVASPSGPGITPAVPFVVNTTEETVNGVTVPVGVYMDAAFIKNGTITNAKIGNAAIDDAKIANLSADKITAGSIAVGRHIQSAGYTPGSVGWHINGNGTAEFSSAVIRGTVYSGAGLIGGNVIDATGIESPDYEEGVSGWRLDSSGALHATSGTFSGSLSGANISGASGTFSGSLSGADITGATGTFSGTISAGSVDFASSVGFTYSYGSPGSYTIVVPSGMTNLRATLQGGGGGGGAQNPYNYGFSGGGGGGGGGWKTGTYAVTPGTSVRLTVGSGGAGGASGSSGDAGGRTKVEKFVSGIGWVELLAAEGGGGGYAPQGGASPGYGGYGSADYGEAGVDGGGRGGNSKMGYGGAGGTGAGYEGTGGYPGSGYGGGGGGAPGSTNYGKPGGNGAGGWGQIEVFDPNGVVLRGPFDTLKSELRAQGLTLT